MASTPAPDRPSVPPASSASGDPIEQARWAQTSDRLTTANGLPLPDTDHSLKAGARGPSLLEDHHLREKITHFDHERIPERVVHARGAGAHGVFRSYDTAARWTRARFLAEADVQTPVFVRFSTVVGSRGSADTVRDVRGFAVKLSTEEGVFDLVGNNIPVFFIQDGIKFPDIIHAAKPHPDREIPQAQTAHDTFWDFASLHTETTHMLMWIMSDRAIPRPYRMMEGFGVHTFRLVGADGGTHLVKFHWKPAADVHSLVWEEAQLAAGVDPDFHRRDLADAIDSGALPEWELGVQVMPDTPEQTFQGIDLLDPTKIVPEELVPVQPVGRLTLTANPSNYFAETEQVAFHVGHLVPGIEVTDDPLIQARLFSYLDTQLADYFTQARLFWVSMSPVEQAHIVSAFTFELGKCASETVRRGMVANLARIDPDLCARVAAGPGLPAPTPSGHPLPDVTPSPALSQLSDRVWPASGRVVAGGRELAVDRALMTTRSVEYDALAVGPGVTILAGQPELAPLLTEVFRQGKPMLVWGDGAQVLETVGLSATAPGVVLADQLTEELAGQLLALTGRHRIWDRTTVTA